MADPEQIGKYRILSRIGRGGMGMIFKAYDPILNRSVALKVISTDIDITDEIRARFYREARACARLSHPNIVTVYDMGEDGGQMFIVMELLDGVELHHLIAEHATVALEERLSIMTQVCEGLSYAHQQGIVHRDIKPSNIMRLRNGQVKILDFGIAQIENLSSETLTRTGLIMGTLRYMAPEQVRGRADHRSDIFSVGAVFYELLCSRPPFNAKDAIQLLEQLRTDHPVPPHLVDPTIPAELSDIVAGAMQKDPDERVHDLDQIRDRIEHLRRTLAEEAGRVRARTQTQRDQLGQLQTALADRIGSATKETGPKIDEPRHLAALQALEVDLAGRIQAAQGILARAEVLAPALERGNELLRGGQFAEAVTVFEGIVAELPEHVRAIDRLAEARVHADAQRCRELATKAIQDVRAAIAANDYVRCLEILDQAAAIPPPAEAVQEIASLRGTVEAAVAALPVRQQSEAARVQMTQARRAAQQKADIQYATVLWYEAEAKSGAAETAYKRTAYKEAGQEFRSATAAYRRFEEASLEARGQARDAAERARDEVAQGRQRALVADAPQHAREQWEAAEATYAAAQAAFATDAMGHAAEIFSKTKAAYGQAEETARVARQRETPAPEKSRPGGQAPLRVTPAGPVRVEGKLPDRAPTGPVDGPETIASPNVIRRPDPDVADKEPRGRQPVEDGTPRRLQPVEDGTPLPSKGPRSMPRFGWVLLALGGLAAIVFAAFQWLTPHPSTAPPGPQVVVPSPSPPVAPQGRGAGVEQTTAPSQPGGALQDRPQLGKPQGPAPAKPEGEPAKSGRDRPDALPGRGEGRSVESPTPDGRRDVERARAQAAGARRAAEQLAAAFFAPQQFSAAQAKDREAAQALQQGNSDLAIRLLHEAQSDYQAAALEAKRQADLAHQAAPLKARVEQARSAALARREQALAADAERLAVDLLRTAELKHAQADRLAASQSLEEALRAYNDAVEQYGETVVRARAAASGGK